MPSNSKYQTELERERALLVNAERNLLHGEESVREHLVNMQAQLSRGNGEAGRLLQRLQGALAQWTRHRDTIRDRVTYLEARLHGCGG